MYRTADFRDADMNGIDDRDQPNFSGPSQNYLDQRELARNLLNPKQVGNNPPQMPIQPIRRNPSPFGNNLSMGRFGGYNQPQPFMGGFGMPQMGYGGGFGYGIPQMPFMGGFGGYGGGFGMQPRMPQMGYGGFGGFGMPQMGGYGNPFGQSFYGGLGSFMGQPSFPQQGMPRQSRDRFGMPIHQGPIMTNNQIRPPQRPVMQMRSQPAPLLPGVNPGGQQPAPGQRVGELPRAPYMPQIDYGPQVSREEAEASIRAAYAQSGGNQRGFPRAN